MTTTATKKTNSRLAAPFIAIMAVAGLTMLVGSVFSRVAFHQYQFMTLLALGAVTSRTKIKLPGVDGTMSVNLPFILIAASQLSLFEAVVVALFSALLQSLPQRGGKIQPVKLLFNASTIVLATGATAILLRHELLASMQVSPAIDFALACVLFLLVNTLPVATIISLTEGSGILHIWLNILNLSFPYYVACTGVTFMVTVAGRHVGWQAPLIVLPVMFFLYRSFRHLFAVQAVSAPAQNTMTHAAAAH
jgi:hypothetical protein